MANVESSVETARRAVVGTAEQAASIAGAVAEQAASIAGAAWEQAQELAGEAKHLVEDDVVAPIGRLPESIKNRVNPPPSSGPSPLVWILALVGIIVVGGVVFWRVRQRRADDAVERAGATRGEGVPDAYGAAVTATEGVAS